MDFIERILHLSLDHGDGTLELVMLAAAALAAAAWLRQRLPMAASRRSRCSAARG